MYDVKEGTNCKMFFYEISYFSFCGTFRSKKQTCIHSEKQTTDKGVSQSHWVVKGKAPPTGENQGEENCENIKKITLCINSNHSNS
jgi:hypothetical protein